MSVSSLSQKLVVKWNDGWDQEMGLYTNNLFIHSASEQSHLQTG